MAVELPSNWNQIGAERFADAVLATGRLNGNLAAAEMWLERLPDWDASGVRAATRLLRHRAHGDEISENVADYVTEMCTLMLALGTHGVRARTPREIEESLRSAFHRSVAEPGRSYEHRVRPRSPHDNSAWEQRARELFGLDYLRKGKL